jgi:nicotinamide riboside kinase
MTKIINLYGGPGTGKSTTAAYTFAKLKAEGHNAELVTEYAKELVWEERHKALANQTYILGKQSYRVQRLLDKVDVIVTDSPILLSLIYGKNWEALDNLTLDIHRSWDTLDIFLERNPDAHPYNPLGRYQTEEEAKLLDITIKATLELYRIPFTTIKISTAEKVAEEIVDLYKSL